MELNWGVGYESQAWGEGKLPLSVTQVYNGKLRGAGRVTQLFAANSFLPRREPEDTLSVPHLTLLRRETNQTGQDSPIFRLFLERGSL